MTVYRISREPYIRDLSGEGARLFGGRWNRKGTPVLYTAESRALATVETLVHLTMPLLPKDLRIARIRIPEDTSFDRVELEDLPPGWAGYPPPLKLSIIGDEWARSNTSLCLSVPSAAVPGDRNILINPNHPEAGSVTIIDVEPYHFDQRLFNR